MKSRIIIGIIAAALATVAVVVVSTATASASAMGAYSVALGNAGYRVSAGASVDHATLHQKGLVLTAAKGDKTVTLEFIEYPSRAELQRDFVAVNGAGPKPAVATGDFDGRVLYWNEQAVLAVSFAPPNEPGLARAAADVFLGRSGTGGPGTAGGGKVTMPDTGSGGYLPGAAAHSSPVGRLWILAVSAGAVVACAGIASAVRERR